MDCVWRKMLSGQDCGLVYAGIGAGLDLAPLTDLAERTGGGVTIFERGYAGICSEENNSAWHNRYKKHIPHSIPI